MSLPYHSILIDSSPGQFTKALNLCLSCREEDRSVVASKLVGLWTSQTGPQRRQCVLPCLSVRSGLDLFLQTQAYPPGSEVIMTAVNIPDIAAVIRHHALKIVPVDISIDTLEPSGDDLERLVSGKTVAILVAHLFGRWLDMEPIAAVAQKHNLHLIEDCAESFCGFSRVGHDASDISLFSFGVIKFSTSFGGGIARIRDHGIWTKMKRIQSLYPLQSNLAYLKKVLKYALLFTLLYTRPIPQGAQALYRAGYDLKALFVKCIRGFSPDSVIASIRYQPSVALLSNMLHTQSTFDPAAFGISKTKGDYFLCKLATCGGDGMYPMGTKAKVNNHWLFPVLVKNPGEIVKALNLCGVTAYSGSTQLSLIQGDITLTDSSTPEVDDGDERRVQAWGIGGPTDSISTCVGGDAVAHGGDDFVHAGSTRGENASYTPCCKQLDERAVYTPLLSSHKGKNNVFNFHPDSGHSHRIEVGNKNIDTRIVWSEETETNFPDDDEQRGDTKFRFPPRQCGLMTKISIPTLANSPDVSIHTTTFTTPQARLMMNHVIYLPVNKRVPFSDLDKMAAICSRVMSEASGGSGRGNRPSIQKSDSDGDDGRSRDQNGERRATATTAVPAVAVPPPVRLKSKL